MKHDAGVHSLDLYTLYTRLEAEQKHLFAIIRLMRIAKIVGFGLVNYAVRFAVGGLLYKVVAMNPLGFGYGFLLTLTAFVASFIFLRFVIKPITLNEALFIAGVWVVMALVLDIVTAQPIVGVTPSYLLQELQTWTRLLAVLAAGFFSVRQRIEK